MHRRERHVSTSGRLGQDAEAHASDSAPRLSAKAMGQVVLLSLALTAVGGVWVRESSWVSGACQLDEAVPPIPAFAGLLFLLGVNALLRRRGARCGLSQGVILGVYVMLTLSISMISLGVGEYLFAWLSGFGYHPGGTAQLDPIRTAAPDWLVPKDTEAMRLFHEGNRGAGVPWRAWALPLASWSLFLVLLFGTLLCLAALFYRPWAEHERLRFPLVQFITEVSHLGERRSFLRDPVMWAGFAVAAVYNLSNMVQAIAPGWPHLGDVTVLIPPETPAGHALYPLRGLSFRYDLLLFGLGYLVSLEMLFSVWFSQMLIYLQAMVGYRMGVYAGGFPYPRDQALGAFVALAVGMLWTSRRHLGRVVRSALGKRDPEEPRDPMPHRSIVFGALGGLLAMGVFCRAAGMPGWVAALFLFFIVACALVYTRIRAEVGAPMIWLFPIHRQTQFFTYAFGSNVMAPGGSLAPMAALSAFGLLARGYAPALMSYQMEAFKLADDGPISRRSMAWLCLLGVILGLPFSYYLHLTTAYFHGANMLQTVKGYTEHVNNLAFAQGNMPVDWARLGWTGGGLATTLLLLGLRLRLVWFPLHPLGYAIACSKGFTLWGPFLAVWLIKYCVLRFGGRLLFIRTVPFFLGIVLGHFFLAGVVWGGLGLTGSDLFRAYVVYFG